MTQSQLNASFSANSAVASMYEDTKVKFANSDTIIEIIKVIDNTTEKFNNDLKELLIIKLNNIFNEEVYNGANSLEINPMNYQSWTNEIDNVQESDFENIKKIMDYYKLDFNYVLEFKLIDNVYNYFVKEHKFNYNGIDSKLYTYLTGKKYQDIDDIEHKIFDYYSDKYDKLNKGKNNNKEIEELNQEVKKCDYLSSDNKDELVSFGKNREKNNSSNIRKKIVKGAFSLVGIVIYAFLVYGYIREITGRMNGFITIFGYIGLVIALYFTITRFFVALFDGIKTIFTKSTTAPKELRDGAKKKWLSIILCIFFGTLGVHQFYLGDGVKGVVYFFTFGWFGVGVVIDLIKLIATPAEIFEIDE